MPVHMSFAFGLAVLAMAYTNRWLSEELLPQITGASARNQARRPAVESEALGAAPGRPTLPSPARPRQNGEYPEKERVLSVF
jgi:hypothetical protein